MMGRPNGMMGGSGSFGPGVSLLGVLLLVALLAAAIWFAYMLLSGRRDAEAARPQSGAALAERLLRERFARGEMDAEEYERSFRTLRGNPAPGSYEDFVRDARGNARERAK